MSREAWSPGIIAAAGIVILLAVLTIAAIPVITAWESSGEDRIFWLQVAGVASTTAATVVIGGIALFQTLANARLHREAEEARNAQATRERDDQVKLEMREVLAARLGERSWRNWIVNLHVDNREHPNREAFFRDQFDQVGVDYLEFMRLYPDLKARVDDAVARGARAE